MHAKRTASVIVCLVNDFLSVCWHQISRDVTHSPLPGRISCIFVHEWLRWRVAIRFLDGASLICTCCSGMPACFPILCIVIVRLHWEWELVWALGCKLDDLESLHVGFCWWKPPLRLLWVSSVVSDYTRQRRTGEAMQWELSASWEERKRWPFMLCPCSYILVKWATVPWNLISESPAAVSCSTCGLACKCLSHFSIQKSKPVLLSRWHAGLLQISLPVWCAFCLCCSAKPDGCRAPGLQHGL